MEDAEIAISALCGGGEAGRLESLILYVCVITIHHTLLDSLFSIEEDFFLESSSDASQTIKRHKIYFSYIPDILDFNLKSICLLL